MCRRSVHAALHSHAALAILAGLCTYPGAHIKRSCIDADSAELATLSGTAFSRSYPRKSDSPLGRDAQLEATRNLGRLAMQRREHVAITDGNTSPFPQFYIAQTIA